MDIYLVLSEQRRRDILEILAEKGKLAASTISSYFKVSQAAISQHLKVLKDAGLVKVEKKAQQRIYEINPERLKEIEVWSRKMTLMWEKRFDKLDQLLQEEKKRKANLLQHQQSSGGD